MSRVLFLDFDGVLHPAGGPPGETLPFEWVAQLNELLDAHAEVLLVVHSSWRERFSAEELRDFLGPLGDRLLGAVERGPKAQAILAFVREHPEIERWMVIDDSASEFSTVFESTVVICDPAKGICDPVAQAAVRRWLDEPNGSAEPA